MMLTRSHFDQTLIALFGLFNLLFIWLEYSALVTLVSLSFLSAYAFYGFLFQYNLPNWLVMVGILLIFGYLFLYTEQRIGILGNKRLIYLFLFSLISLEVFLALAFFLINPLSKSLIMAVVSYVFVGFCYVVLAKHDDNKLSTYLTVALISMFMVFISSGWGGAI